MHNINKSNEELKTHFIQLQSKLIDLNNLKEDLECNIIKLNDACNREQEKRQKLSNESEELINKNNTILLLINQLIAQKDLSTQIESSQIVSIDTKIIDCQK